MHINIILTAACGVYLGNSFGNRTCAFSMGMATGGIYFAVMCLFLAFSIAAGGILIYCVALYDRSGSYMSD